jgi:hypothetical protein
MSISNGEGSRMSTEIAPPKRGIAFATQQDSLRATIARMHHNLHRAWLLPLRDELIAFIERGHPVGGFLEALLSNDLRDACERATADNLWLLPIYVGFLRECAPADAWGSREKVAAWIANKRAERESRTIALPAEFSIGRMVVMKGDALRIKGQIEGMLPGCSDAFVRFSKHSASWLPIDQLEPAFVNCSRCGIAGDPEGFKAIEGGQFLCKHEGPMCTQWGEYWIGAHVFYKHDSALGSEDESEAPMIGEIINHISPGGKPAPMSHAELRATVQFPHGSRAEYKLSELRIAFAGLGGK